MGVASGLPDFRGNEGLWREYPALKRENLSFEEIANPDSFAKNPALAWGFYGHRLALYRDTRPHEGFDVLRRWAARMEHGTFVFTSNVDGQFQRAEFPPERVAEVHGTIHSFQCMKPCKESAWAAETFVPEVDSDTGLLINAAPTCPHCGRLARPNILMFSDHSWVEKYSASQCARLESWLQTVKRLVVVELGAGRALPTIRRFSERHGPRVIRINPREPEIAPNVGVGIPLGARGALRRLELALSGDD